MTNHGTGAFSEMSDLTCWLNCGDREPVLSDLGWQRSFLLEADRYMGSQTKLKEKARPQAGRTHPLCPFSVRT